MRVVFMGSGDIGVPSLKMLLGWGGCDVVGVVTQPDRAAGRGLEVRESAVKQVASDAGVVVQQPERLRAPEAVTELAALEPDVIVVMAYGQILSRQVLDLPRLACLNLHASLLPRWRGASPIQAAIQAGDLASGITVMHMAEGLDTGDILLTRELAIAPDETGGSLHDRLAELAPAALAAALELLQRGEAPREVQDEAAATLTRKLTRDDGWLDWSRPAEELERLVRAMDPWPGTNGEVVVGGVARRLKVLRVAVGTGEVPDGVPPGVALGAAEEGVEVATGRGILVLREVQAEGRRRMAAADWLRGAGVGKS